MYLAGVPTGMAAAVDDGSTAVLVRQFLRAAMRGRYHSASVFLRAAPIGYSRSAPMRCATDSLRAASHLRSVKASTSVNAFGAAPIGYSRSAPMCCATDSLGAASHLRSVKAFTSVNALHLLPAASIEALPKVCDMKRMCSLTAVDNTGKEEPSPAVPTKWAKLLSLLIKLKSNIFMLVLISICVWIGFLAVKEKPIAKDIVDVCDKAHKIYNITSKAFLIIADILKGDK